MNWKKRTAKCGELNKEQVGKSYVLNGWISSVRNMGGLIFIDLRDRYGIMQLVIEPENNAELAEKAKELKSEYVIWCEGKLRLRTSPNPKLPTGYVELLLDNYGVINKSELPPFEISDDIETNEEIKLRYRYLDLRRHSLQKNFIIRNRVYQTMHTFFDEKGFLEIETPILMKSTPEGARDFLVPSRINKGKFYALPQSPQIFKQILMVSGFDKYIQIAKCFRDEDLRSDRQPEFTQIDIEMSFVEKEDIFELIEEFIAKLWKNVLNIDVKRPFKKMKYQEAMERFGSDKPDLRFGMEVVDITEDMKNCEFKVFSEVIANNGRIALINAKNAAHYSRKQIDMLTEFAKKYGAKGLAYIKYDKGEINSPIAKFLTKEELDSITEKANAQDGDLILISSDEKERALIILGALRLEMAKQLGIIEKVKDDFSFHWVVDFPLFEYDEEEKRYVAMHHPFTAPKSEDIEFIDTNPEKLSAQAYDLVVNGAELGGGSVRIHENDIQQKIFKLIGLKEEEAEEKFGYLLKALKFGAPPHAGIALGLDRIVMMLAKTENIRDVIAFPKTTSGISIMDGAPSEVDEKQLKELNICLIKKEV